MSTLLLGHCGSLKATAGIPYSCRAQLKMHNRSNVGVLGVHSIASGLRWLFEGIPHMSELGSCCCCGNCPVACVHHSVGVSEIRAHEVTQPCGSNSLDITKTSCAGKICNFLLYARSRNISKSTAVAGRQTARDVHTHPVRDLARPFMVLKQQIRGKS